jgi:hypothetical protein
VIIVDDLERCSSDRALEVCQVASQLLAQPGVVAILLADMEPIARSAGARYAASMPDGAAIDPEEIGRRYLAKIVQLEIALPPPSPADMRRVIREYGPSMRHALPDPVAARPSRWQWLRGALRPERSGFARTVARMRWWPIVVWFLLGVIYGAFTPGWTENDNSDPASIIWFSLFVPALILSLWSRRLRKRARQQRSELKEQIEQLKDKQLSPEQVEHEVLHQTATDTKANVSLISDLVSSSFLDSAEFRAVETYISENPPALPREAKRSFNHAQLLTEIARARHMFGGEPQLTPAHLAKWLVLREQWPALGRRIAVEPEGLAQLQAADVTPEAWELLCEEPPLVGVIERLVYFQPANGRPPF